jgi:hydrogenase maturation protein HypF
MLEKGLRSPFGASMGAFLAAMCAISGACLETSYGREPVMLLESLAARSGDARVQPYSYDILDDGNLLLIDPARIVYEAVENMLARRSAEMVAARTFETVVEFTVDACRKLAPRAGTDKIVLTGEAFESRFLTEKTSAALESEDFKVLTHGVVPPNDGGISVGQAFVARARHTDRFREGQTRDISR